MTSQGYKFGHSTISGNPAADWSHAASYLARLNKEQLDTESPEGDNFDADTEFRGRLTAASGISELSQEDFDRAEELAAHDGVDISYFPGGDNYRVSLVSDANPLGLPGDLWAAVSDPSEGALVSALVRTTNEGELEVKWPDGYDWQDLADPSVISDYDLVGVTADAVELFKNYDRDNTLGVIGSYPLSDTGPFPTQAHLEIPMSREIMEPRGPDDEYWANSGEVHGEPVERSDDSMMDSAVVIEDEDDLEAAITAAIDDPDIRWYVERRVQALELEADLPWQKD